MAVTQTSVISVRVRVPIAVGGNSIVVNPALTTFINTATPLTVDGRIYTQERNNYDWSLQWLEMEFITTSANATSLETAANTLQTSLNTQNGNPSPALVVDAQAQNSTRVTFS